MKIVILTLLNLFISLGSFGQIVDFQLLEATKTSELLIDRALKSESLIEVDILPEKKRYLIITAEINYKGEQSLRLGKEDVTIGREMTKAVGYLKLSRRGDLQWGYKGSLWQGKNYFSAIFIVDSNLSQTTINIKNQSFEISKITQNFVATECIPKVSIAKKEYLSEITYESAYRNANNQPFAKKISPKNGKLLSVSLNLEFCENADYFTKSSFHFESTYFQIQNSEGILFNCVGTFQFGKFNKPSTFNILNTGELTQEVTLIFNAPSEGKYVINYLGNKVAVL